MLGHQADEHRPDQPVADEAATLELASIGNLDLLQEHLDRLQKQISSLGAEMETLRQHDQAVNEHAQRLREELALAARVQQDFLPKALPEVGSPRFAALYRPVGFVSGDLYDVFRLDESHVGFYVADAVGHGMPAALLTMFLKNALVAKEILPEGYRLLTPAQTLRQLNASLIEQRLSQATFVTAAYAVVNVEQLVMTLARAGHPLPLRLRNDGTIQELQPEGSLLGIFPDEQFPDLHVKLEPGDRVAIFSDGVELIFGEQWRQELIDRRAMSASELVADLARVVDSRRTLQDDLTLVVMDVGR